jgi:hypothetical protein
MTRGIVPHARRWWCPRRGLSPRVWAHAPIGAGLVVRGGDLSCEAETCRARRGLVVEVPLVGNWSEMQPTGLRLRRFASVGLDQGLYSSLP